MRARRAATGGVREGRRQKAECRIKRRALGAANGGNRGGGGESGRSIQVNQDDPITSDQIRPNQTKSDQKKRSSPDQGAGRWIKTDEDESRFGSRALDGGSAERMNGKAKGLSDRKTYFICFTGEGGSGLEENLRLSSLIPAYSRLFPLNGRKMFEAPPS